MTDRGQMIVPWEETIKISPFHRVRRTLVPINPDDSHWMSGRQGDRTLMLSKAQIESLAIAANISDVESKPLPASHPRIINWQYTMEMTIGSETKRAIRTYELDMRLKSDGDGEDGSYIILARHRAQEKARKARENAQFHQKWTMPDRDAPDEEWDVWVEEQAMKDWTMTYRHKTARAETGAALRAMRRLLRIKATYNEKELEEPFRVYRIEADLSGALQYGGQVGDMARRMIGAAFSRQLGMDAETVSGLLAATTYTADEQKEEGPEDLLPATEEEISDLESKMLEAGYPDRATCDESTMALFDLPLSQLTKRHTSIILESIELRKIAKERLTDEEMKGFTESVRAAMRIAFADGMEIVDILEREWWERLFDVEVEDESD